MTGYLPYAVDMVLESGMFSAAFSISGQKFTEQLETKRQSFDAQFERTFGLEAKVPHAKVDMYLDPKIVAIPIC